MDQTPTVRGRYAGLTFIPDEPLPEAEGAAELMVTLTTVQPRGSIADAFGTAPVPRTGEDILAQVRSERDEWDDR